MAAPDEASIPWPEHALAVSGGEILATHILPRMGHAARDFARAAAVCRGWRAAAGAETAVHNVYADVALEKTEAFMDLVWSPCGKYVAAADNSYRVFIWRTSTGALVSEWDLADSFKVPESTVHLDAVAFSRDSSQLLTLFLASDTFAVWSVPDGQLIAVRKYDVPGVMQPNYEYPDFGVPGSASQGLVGFTKNWAHVDLWDVSPPPEGGANLPRLRGRVDLDPVPAPDVNGERPFGSLKFSPDGSKFASAFFEVVYVYDVASLTRLAV